jgi:hypothetical protein
VPRFGELAPDAQVPPAVEELVRRGLAKTTDERFASADEYVAEIDRLRAELVPGFVRPTTLPPGVTLPLGEGSAPVARYTHTPMPVVPTAAIAVPKRRITFGWIVAAILTIGVVAAIVAGSGGSTSSTASAPPGGLLTLPLPVTVASGADADTRLKAALHDLDNGATCADRKKAVAALRDLGDARAIPALKKARYRGRGGVLGLGERNTNSCLRADADAAIAALGGK